MITAAARQLAWQRHEGAMLTTKTSEYLKDWSIIVARSFPVIILALAGQFPAIVHADCINLSGAETSPNIAGVYVMDDHVRVILDVLEDLVANGWVSELDAHRQRIGEFLLECNVVLIDTEPVKPILDRTSFVKVSINGIRLLEQPQRLEISTAIVGVIITYLVDALPQQVTVDRDLLNDQIQRVPRLPRTRPVRCLPF